MNTYQHRTTSLISVSSPTSVSGDGHGYTTTSKPILIQSNTPTSKASLAKVFNRAVAKVKGRKTKKNSKNIQTNHRQKYERIQTNNIKQKSESSPLQQQQCRQNSVPVKVENKTNQENESNVNCSNEMPPMNNEKISNLLASKGYFIKTKLADTLQGQIYRCLTRNVLKFDACNGRNNEQSSVVIKVTRKDLHNQKLTILEDGKKKKIQEDIIKERDILIELGDFEHITRFVDFFEDSDVLCLVMEDGGQDLFEYVVKCHRLIKMGKLDRKEWRLICKKLFRQIVQTLDYLHNVHSICHLDISLENMLIQNGHILQDKQSGKLSLNRNGLQIKFCDFGLAEKFKHGNFECQKYVGKTRYKSPELWTKKLIFDARSNDIWSLGIALFMMILGAPPLKYPDMHDKNFRLIIGGDVLELIQSWNRAKYMTPQILDLLKRMLTSERERIGLDEMMRHSWVKLKE